MPACDLFYNISFITKLRLIRNGKQLLYSNDGKMGNSLSTSYFLSTG